MLESLILESLIFESLAIPLGHHRHERRDFGVASIGRESSGPNELPGDSAKRCHRKLGVKGEEEPSFDDVGERFRTLLVETEADDPTRQRTVTERLEGFPIGHARP